MAEQVVILGGTMQTHELVSAPNGWRKLHPVHRSTFLGGIYWTPIRRNS